MLDELVDVILPFYCYIDSIHSITSFRIIYIIQRDFFDGQFIFNRELL